MQLFIQKRASRPTKAACLAFCAQNGSDRCVPASRSCSQTFHTFQEIHSENSLRGYFGFCIFLFERRQIQWLTRNSKVKLFFILPINMREEKRGQIKMGRGFCAPHTSEQRCFFKKRTQGSNKLYSCWKHEISKFLPSSQKFRFQILQVWVNSAICTSEAFHFQAIINWLFSHNVLT